MDFSSRIILLVGGGILLMIVGALWRSRRAIRAAVPASQPKLAPDLMPLIQLRQDLVVQLVQTVKACAAYDHPSLDAVVTASVAAAASSARERADAQTSLTEALHGLFASAESNPELSANPRFADLRVKLADVEQRLDATKGFFGAPASVSPDATLKATGVLTDLMMLRGDTAGAEMAQEAAEGVAATSLFVEPPSEPGARQAKYAKALAEDQETSKEAGDKAS